MCGAFSILHPFRDQSQMFNAGYNEPFKPRYNARPGQWLPVVLSSAPDRLEVALWGITPPWKTGSPIINARKESLETKVVYNEPFRKRRCVIPADGFYEWATTTTSSGKVPYRFQLKTRKIFYFAGIWQEQEQADGTRLPAFAIITVEPNELVGKVHNRMPAILAPHHEHKWLEPIEHPTFTLDLLKPYPSNLMRAYPVSTLVNSPKKRQPRGHQATPVPISAILYTSWRLGRVEEGSIVIRPANPPAESLDDSK